MGSSSKGAARERELVNRFDAAGWGALRLPSSGSATKRELPDVLTGRGERFTDWSLDVNTDEVVDNGHDYECMELWAIELKSGAQTTLYVDEQEVDDLEAFASSWGARPLLGARFTFNSGEHYGETDTYLVDPDAARRTDGGAYGLPVDDIRERAFAIVTKDAVERL